MRKHGYSTKAPGIGRRLEIRSKGNDNRTDCERIYGAADYIINLLNELDNIIYEAGGIQTIPETSQLEKLRKKMQVTSTLISHAENQTPFPRGNGKGGACFD